MSAPVEPTAKAVFVDEEVTSVVLAVIRDARKYTVVVTPYLKLWGHAKQAIEQAVKRGTKVTFILRQEVDVINKAMEDVTWLIERKVRILTVPYLHAKIYLNESTAVLSSMNILTSSSQNSLEFAIRLKDTNDEKEIRDYVDRLKNAAEPIDVWAKRLAQEQSANSSPATGSPSSTTSVGACIRCGQPVPPDPNRPLCGTCYASWAEYENEDYPEHFCLICGRQAEVSYRKPMCYQCYQAYPR